MTNCEDCARAQAEPWDGFTNGCKGCDARALAYLFLRKGERGQRFRMACEQAQVTEQQVRQAWAVDACNGTQAEVRDPGTRYAACVPLNSTSLRRDI